MIVETKWGRFDGDYLLTNGGAIIHCPYVFTQDAQVSVRVLMELKKYLRENSIDLGGVEKVTMTPAGKDVYVRVFYEGGVNKAESAQELYFRAVLDCFTQNKATFDSPKGALIMSSFYGEAHEGEFLIEPYVAALLKL